MVRDLSRNFFQRRHTAGQQIHEKVLGIINYQGNANQSHSRYQLTPVRMTIVKRQGTTSIGKMWGKGNPCALLVEVKIGAVSREKHIKFCQKLKVQLVNDPATPLLCIFPKKTKTLS